MTYSLIQRIKFLGIGALALMFVMVGSVSAQATIIDYTHYTLTTLVTNTFYLPSSSPKYYASDKKIVNTAVYPSSLNTYLSNVYSSVLGTITDVGDASGSVKGSLHTVSLVGSGSVVSTIASHSYGGLTTQDARFYGYFTGMGNISLPVSLTTDFSTTSKAITYQDSLEITLENLTTGASTVLLKVQNYSVSGILHELLNFSTIPGDNYLISTQTGLEQLDYIYGAGMTASYSQLEIGAPEPATYILLGTGLIALGAIF
jgi:hypothetical protein